MVIKAAAFLPHRERMYRDGAAEAHQNATWCQLQLPPPLQSTNVFRLR